MENGEKKESLDVKSVKKERVREKKSVDKRVCIVCGSSFLVPSGTCFICLNCGSSSGCS
jgi:hypothetical protein